MLLDTPAESHNEKSYASHDTIENGNYLQIVVFCKKIPVSQKNTQFNTYVTRWFCDVNIVAKYVNTATRWLISWQILPSGYLT